MSRKRNPEREARWIAESNQNKGKRISDINPDFGRKDLRRSMVDMYMLRHSLGILDDEELEEIYEELRKEIPSNS